MSKPKSQPQLLEAVEHPAHYGADTTHWPRHLCKLRQFLHVALFASHREDALNV